MVPSFNEAMEEIFAIPQDSSAIEDSLSNPNPQLHLHVI